MVSSSTLPRAALLLVLAVSVILAVVNRVSRKMMLDSYGPKYGFFRQELTNLMYNVWVTIFVVPRVYNGTVTKEMLAFPIWQLCIVSICDASSDFFSSVGGVYTPGNYQVMISQTAVIFVMTLSVFVLKTKYHILAMGGAALTVAGAVIAITPSLVHQDTENMKWFSVLLFSLSNVPAAGSYLATEFFLKVRAMDYLYLSCVTSWIQLALTWALVPLTSLPGFGGVPLGDIPWTFRQGLQCFLGDTSIPVLDTNSAVTGYCGFYQMRITFFFSLTGFGAGVAQLILLQYAPKGAALCAVSNVLQLPLTNLAFAIPSLSGEATTPFSWTDGAGLAVVVVGFTMYTYFTKVTAQETLTVIEPDRSPLLKDDDDGIQEINYVGASVTYISDNSSAVWNFAY